MEDSLIEEYLKTRLYDIQEKDLPDKITLPSGEVLVRNNKGFTDRRGNTYSEEDVKNFIRNQKQRRNQNIENNKRWRYKPEDRFNDPDYVDGSADSYGSPRDLLRIGDIEFYEDPNMAKVVDLMKRYNGVAYMVTNNGHILISQNKDFCESPTVRMIQKFYRVEPEKVGIISMMPRGLIFPGIGGNLVVTKGLYRRQADNVRDAIKVLTKAYPFTKASPQTENFFKWVDTAWGEWHAPASEFEFVRWLKKGYSEEEYRGPEPDYTELKRRRYQGKSASYAPFKAGFSLEDELRNKTKFLQAPSEKDLEKTNRSISVEFTGEAKKVRDIIDQAYKANKINKQIKIKAEIALKRAIQNNSDKAIFQLKSIMLKALKG